MLFRLNCTDDCILLKHGLCPTEMCYKTLQASDDEKNKGWYELYLGAR